jgi:hypothetical protein
MGQTAEGIVADIDVAPATMAVDEPRFAEATERAPEPVSAEQSAPARTEPEAEAPSSDWVEVPVTSESATVTSVGLGEITPPDLEPEQPALEEPREFDMGSFEVFGEREDDIDIEEID